MVRYKLRTGFMMLGTLVGVAALTLVLSVGEAAERKILSTVRQLFGVSSIMVYAGGGLFTHGPHGTSGRLTIEDIEALARELDAIEAWDPLQALSGVLRHADSSVTARVMGQSERWERVWDRSVSRGESFDAAAVAGSARVALLGETVVRDLFGSEEPLGAEILIGSVPFRVLGILDPLGTDAHGMDRDNEVVVPITTAMRRLLNVDTIRQAKLLVKAPAEVEPTAEEVKRVLRERHGLGAGQPDDFTVLTPSFVQARVGQVQRVSFVFLPLVAAISLVAGGVVAASLMLASVAARVGEIGLRRAVGARPVDIGLQFLLETAATTLGGGLVGLLIGCAGAQLVASRMGLGGILSGKAILLGIAAAAATGLLAGVGPARRAARLQPAEALR
jgi:putative ABC transport system permease protein